MPSDLSMEIPSPSLCHLQELQHVIGVDVDGVAIQSAERTLKSVARERSSLSVQFLEGNFR